MSFECDGPGYGPAYGLSVDCEPERWTRVSISLPAEEEPA